MKNKKVHEKFQLKLIQLLNFFFYVLYVPEITQNLLSVAQMLEKSYKISFENKLCMMKALTT